MKIIEVVQKLRASNAKRFGQIPEKQAAALVTAALREILEQLDGTADGKLAVPGFGQFMVKQVEREKDGAKLTRKRVVFRPAKAKPMPKVAGKGTAAKAARRKPAA